MLQTKWLLKSNQTAKGWQRAHFGFRSDHKRTTKGTVPFGRVLVLFPDLFVSGSGHETSRGLHVGRTLLYIHVHVFCEKGLQYHICF